jgi:hypothetical protein
MNFMSNENDLDKVGKLFFVITTHNSKTKTQKPKHKNMRTRSVVFLCLGIPPLILWVMIALFKITIFAVAVVLGSGSPHASSFVNSITWFQCVKFLLLPWWAG